MELDDEDKKLIELAKSAIKPVYDGVRFMHTVGAAIMDKRDKVYQGVNVYSVHGACAEVVALGRAITEGARDFCAIVAVNGKDGNVMSPCGNCRQVLADIAPDINVIISEKEKLPLADLLPLAYRVE